VAFEPEFALYRRVGEGAYEPADRYAMYSVDRIDAHHELLARIEEALAAQGVRVVQLGSEYGAGQVEINLAHAAPRKAADDLVTFRETVKALAREAGLVASFMPKPFADAAGSGVHVHLSLWDREGRADRSAGEGPLGLSEELGRFMAGVLAHAPALCGVAAPTPNSYKRLLPASWAPAHVGYAAGNRAALVRVPGASRRRIEFRAGDHTGNPYLALATLIAAGLDGLDRQLDPGPPVKGDLGHLSAEELARQGIRMLPRSAGEALDAVEADEVVMRALGPVCGPELLRVKRHELDRHDRQVSEWERGVYFERA
jgi:glutamine synthetase